MYVYSPLVLSIEQLVLICGSLQSSLRWASTISFLFARWNNIIAGWQKRRLLSSHTSQSEGSLSLFSWEIQFTMRHFSSTGSLQKPTCPHRGLINTNAAPLSTVTFHCQHRNTRMPLSRPAHYMEHHLELSSYNICLLLGVSLTFWSLMIQLQEGSSSLGAHVLIHYRSRTLSSMILDSEAVVSSSEIGREISQWASCRTHTFLLILIFRVWMDKDLWFYFNQTGGFMLWHRDKAFGVLGPHQLEDLCAKERSYYLWLRNQTSRALVVIQTTWFITQRDRKATTASNHDTSCPGVHGEMAYVSSWWIQERKARVYICISASNNQKRSCKNFAKVRVKKTLRKGQHWTFCNW